MKNTSEMTANPLVSVLLPVYNCEKYVFEAIESILNQTYKNFELLIIDDCSTDNTLEICKSFKDDRVFLIEKEKNSGYTNSLNYAISISKGKYIARMDGDDVSLPERFEKQVHFLEERPQIALCGTAIKKVGRDKALKQPLNHEQIKVKLCFINAFHHPTIMGKTEVFKLNLYDSNFEPAEDYELWTRLVFNYKLANLAEVLLLYRVHDDQISTTKSRTRKQSAFDCNMNMLKYLEIDKHYKRNQLEMILLTKSFITQENCSAGLNLFKTLLELNDEKNIFEKSLFKEMIKTVQFSTFKTFLSFNKIVDIKTINFIFKNTSLLLILNLINYKVFKKFK